jgi:23S rRNA (cytidine2498-2'-O)-methyltransferase
MAHPNLLFIKGDGFRFQPDQPVDWLLCDIIAPPDRSLALLERWLGNAWCRSFVATVKFRGSNYFPILSKCSELLQSHCCDFMLKHLQTNHNEVTLAGRR